MKTVNRWVAGTIAVGMGILLAGNTAFAAEKKTSIELGGKFCNFYLDDVKKALMSVSGVTDVTFNGAQDHAIVTGDDTKMKTSDLVSAVDAVKGNGWFCTGKASP
jgi:mercuric ion binding protein